MNARKRVYSVAGHRRKEVLVAGKIWSRERFGRGKDLVAGKIWSRERFSLNVKIVAYFLNCCVFSQLLRIFPKLLRIFSIVAYFLTQYFLLFYTRHPYTRPCSKTNFLAIAFLSMPIHPLGGITRHGWGVGRSTIRYTLFRFP